ncbi:MAG: DUF4955 domain-containing protein [Candidatus Poribacteria bacterium]|nr:DUF4955 domain-containing protein [Candidatus Poribacteria bacterium]
MIYKVRNWATVVSLFLFLLPLASAQLTSNIWKKFIGEPVPAGVPDLIDYSYAGYKNGEEAIPEDFDYTVYDVTDYGATPDDGQSDTIAIRNALDAASAGRSIVFFPPGQYDVMLDDDVKEPFVVKGHHVIIRGSGAQGAGSGGTTIKMHNEFAEGEDKLFITPPVDNGWSNRPRVVGSFPSGMKSFDVNNATPLIGRQFITIRGDNLFGEDYDKLSSRPLTDLPDSYTRVREGLKVREHHEIDRIEGNRVYIKAPLVTHLKPGMSVLWQDLTVGIGFEDLHIDGSFNEVYEHLVQHGRGGIKLSKTAHSWIRRCRISNVIAAFLISQSYCGSAVNNIVDGRFGHNLGGIFESTYSIVAFLQDRTDRGMVHGPAVSHYSAGSVAWHVSGPLAGGPDTHGAQSRHSLFDNCNSISHHTSGGGRGSLPHHLDGYIRWNNTVLSGTTFNLWVPDGSTFTQGSLIGYKTLGGSVPRNAYFEGFGTHVFPTSLYEAQLVRRLGTLPMWVDAAKEAHKAFFESIVIDPGQSEQSTNTPDGSLDLSLGGRKILGPWLWVVVPNAQLDDDTDVLSKVSGGAVTEQQIATIGAVPGDKVGENEWTSLKIAASGGNNITEMTKHLGWNGNNRIIYGFITLNSPQEQNTRMFVGSDDAVKVWLNGELVHKEIVTRGADGYRSSSPVSLKEGKNTLLVAVGNGTGNWSGFFGFQRDAEYTVLSPTGEEIILSEEGGPKIEGPWLWVLVPDERLDKTTDLLAKVSGGAVTEQQIATHVPKPKDKVGDYEWTSEKIAASGGNNITYMTRRLGWNGNNRVIYGVIGLNSPREQNIKMHVGSDDSVKVWLNGEQVYEKIVVRGANDYQDSFPVTLRQGTNVLLVAVDNGGGGWSGFFGFQGDAEYTVLPPHGEGGPKIVGPWLWLLLSGQRFEENIDLLAKVSGDTVTEQKVAATGVAAGDKVGDYVWTSAKLPESRGNNINNMVDALNWEKSNQNNVIYGSITLNSPREQNTGIFYGTDDGVKIWLNGNLVREDLNKWSAYDYRSNFPVTLKEGKNVLLVAVDNSAGGWSGYFGFRSDAEYTLEPSAGIGYAIFNDMIYPGDTFTFDIYAENVTDLSEWQFDIAFDPLLLKAIEVRKGYFLESAGGVTSFQEGTIDNQSGKIIGFSESEPNGNSVSGTGLLLSVAFTAKTGGETQLTLNNFQFNASGGQAISAGPLKVSLVLKGKLIWDVNEDDWVNILDLVLIAQNLGKPVSVDSLADVNDDGIVNILDLVLVAQHLGKSTAAAGPSAVAIEGLEGVDPATVQGWIEQASAEDDGSLAFRQGIANLERLLASLIPKDTVLLPNYPNPFNPETWIPYQLSESAEVTLRIYAVNGALVRTLTLGLKPVGMYQSRSRAAHWDGKNSVGESVASGVYFYTLTAGEFKSTRKMLIRK